MNEQGSNRAARGRARDPDLDRRILAVAARQLSGVGYEAMSVAGVAAEAGTTRQALYRRWPTKALLAAAALQAAADDGGAPGRQDPYADLVAELADFRRGVSLPGRLSLVGTMLQEATEPQVRAHYQAHVVAPRRARLLAVLRRAHAAGLVDAGADLEMAAGLGPGSWYALALAGQPPPPDWPERAARLVWRSVGGSTG